MNRARYRKPSACLLLAAGLVLVATTAAGLLSGPEGRLVVLVRAREHAVALGLLALAVLTGAVLCGFSKPRARLVAVGVLLGVGLPPLLALSFLSAFAGTHRLEYGKAAPGHGDRRLVVESTSASFGPDTLWLVYVHEGTWPLERRWSVGAFNDDDMDNRLVETVWTAPDRIRMTTEKGAVHEVTLSPGGRPDRFVSVG
ncbi:hypothetical protein [Streptomyces sp. NBC_00347]|uniref:hypothetical protein n=1 Tax=Streptomyces sp. NBC_00347 TaxID=2975721 RepID=UPI00225826B5|nr:hypothetical protein [Streptomyces sp. NBC_00347]MCX5129000.1 hypothetical protein [Streptomyces sp. NBC_00347]